MANIGRYIEQQHFCCLKFNNFAILKLKVNKIKQLLKR